MRIVPLPPTPELEKLLAALLGREVKVRPADGEQPAGVVGVALYRTDEPVIEVAAVCEVGLAVAMAAALSAIPPGVVRDVLSSGKIDASLLENLAEVMNVVARFISASGRRFGLASSTYPPPADLLARARAVDETREVAVEVAGYGAGRLAFNTL
jgi:hypothetical protein